MRLFFTKPLLRALLAASPFFLMSLSNAVAQDDGSRKACGEKWQAAKAANTTNGATWSKFLVECRAAGNFAAAAPAPVANAVVDKPAAAPKAVTPVFPAQVSAKFAELTAGRARQKTCSEQYQANKANGGNAGLRWREKGGGYFSLCNKKLKGA
jgi:hypothetical protein